MDYNEAYHYLNFKIGGDNGLKMLRLIANDKIDEGINFIKELTQCDDNTAQTLWLELKSKYGTSKTNGFVKAKEERKIQQIDQNIPKCPTCGSINLSKIGTLNRMASVGFFGLASNKIGKTYQCKNCGCTW